MYWMPIMIISNNFTKHYCIFKDLKSHNFHYISQFVTGNEVKLLIYPQFRAAKICRKHFKITDVIDFF